MFAPVYFVLLWIFSILQYSGICLGEVVLPYLSLYSPRDTEYTEVIVRRVGDNLTLVCELKGDALPHIYVWNYVPRDNLTDGDNPYKTEPRGAARALASRLTRRNVQVWDSGHYVCSAPEWRFSISKYILVQNHTGACARGALWCGAEAEAEAEAGPGAGAGGRCVLAPYVCDGLADCARGEDEARDLCPQPVCDRPDKLNCSSGRCISEAACCRAGVSPAACRQPACCREHPRYARLEVWGEPDYPALFEDRRAPDEYGFIQSTIYTVTACALIFMIAVVLLVSAICKMHMKRAALRSYTARPHPAPHEARQMSRFPPCYEASRLLEERGALGSPLHSPREPQLPQYTEDMGASGTAGGAGAGAGAGQPARGFGLARLSALFHGRYAPVRTEIPDVELRPVGPASPRRPPAAAAAAFLHYRSPAGCGLGTEDAFYTTEMSDCGRDLNYMATPLEFLRERPRPLTLQLGRFQLSIPRLSQRRSLDRRPDTPNVTELNIEDIDFVRLNSNETYTLNGRTIRLLGADFENYPDLNDNPVRPPPYTESMRYKLFGPPPEYLSRDCLNTDIDNGQREQQARSNIEMPPGYDELNGNAGNIGNGSGNIGNGTDNVGNVRGGEGVSGNIGNAAEDTSNAARNIGNEIANVYIGLCNANGQANASGDTDISNASGNIGNAESNGNTIVTVTAVTEINIMKNNNDDNGNENTVNDFNSVINDLPPIDSDVNANGTELSSVSNACNDISVNNNIEC